MRDGIVTLSPFTQTDWAGFISASLPSVQNAFTRLRDAGLVRTFYRQIEMGVAEAYDYASQVMVRNMLARDAAEGISAFVEKRPPEWQDR